jgi:hypothetical protein
MGTWTSAQLREAICATFPIPDPETPDPLGIPFPMNARKAIHFVNTALGLGYSVAIYQVRVEGHARYGDVAVYKYLPKKEGKPTIFVWEPTPTLPKEMSALAHLYSLVEEYTGGLMKELPGGITVT